MNTTESWEATWLPWHGNCKDAKSKLLVHAHAFNGLTEAGQGDDYYGTSVDLVYSQKINKFSSVKVGYSQSFLDDDFADARAGGEADDIQNWGWVMLIVKPNLFKWKKEKENEVK